MEVRVPVMIPTSPSPGLPASGAAPVAVPALALPAAFLRSWPVSETRRRLLHDLPQTPGVRRLGEHLMGVYPLQGRAEVFEIAIGLAFGLRARVPEPEWGQIPGVLIFPGNILLAGTSVEIVPNPLFDDLDRSGPKLTTGGIFVTGYVASWLAGRYHLGSEILWAAPSGRRITMFEVLGRVADIVPWHNRTLLGHRGKVSRPEVEAQLSEGFKRPISRVGGPLGSGKTAVTWNCLEGHKQWLGLGRRPLGAEELGPELATILGAWSGDAGRGAPDSSGLASLSLAKQVDWLCMAAEVAELRLGAPPTVVIDDVQVAGPEDQDLLANLAQSRRFAQACRLILVGREPSPSSEASALTELPLVRVPAMSAAEMEQLFGELLKGLELGDVVSRRFLKAAAGHPFAFEEGLIRLLHQNKLRSVYGSYFFAGKDTQGYEASERLVRHAAAEAERLGASLAVRILALADHPIEPRHVALAAQRFDAEVEESWYLPFLEAGWLEPEQGASSSDQEGQKDPGEGPRVRFAYPALAQALHQTVSDEGRGTLRHALGSVLAGSVRDETKWSAYRLMAGSPEALPPLLDFTRASTGVVSTREEVFFALWREHKESTERGADRETELQILWALLPLARRLGKLAELESELMRGVELARGDGQKWVPLVALQAELAMDRGDYRQAESGLREALSASEGLGQQRRATLFIRLGALLQREQRYEEATQVFQQLASVVDQNGATALGATCRYYLGNIALQQKKIGEARSLHLAAADHRRQNELLKPLGDSLSALGYVALTEGDYFTALEYFDEAEKTLRTVDAEPSDLSVVFLGKGQALGQLGEITRATKPLRAALEAREGRPNTVDESAARLQLAKNLLALDQIPNALDEVRKAHFQLSLTEEISLLGDVELFLGRVLLKQNDLEAAKEHLHQALEIHGKYGAEQELAEGRSWLVELAIQEADPEALQIHGAELRDLLEDLEFPPRGEQLYYRLYRGFLWLRSHQHPAPDPMPYLSRAYKELMRKTNYLKPDRRHAYLYQVREHQDILNRAAQHQISLPVLTVKVEDLL